MLQTPGAPRPRTRSGRTLAAVVIAAALLVPALPATAVEADNAVLRVGTTQDLDSMNPFDTALVVGFEVFTLNYELLVGYGQDLTPVPGFAETWEESDDGTEYRFTIPDGKLWSDGQPATAEDARWTFQLLLDAIDSEAGALCLGYVDPYLTNAGVTEVAAPDPQTLVVTLDRPNDRILQTYVPILPKHIWEGEDSDSICENQFETPIVGSGPYQAQDWQTGQFVRFERNPNWGRDPLAAEEVVIQIFDSADTMTQALRNDELDYAHGINSDQFDALQGEENIETVEGTANGFTELGFNTYGTGTGNTIENGGPSTPALLDAAFRDAVGYAIDKDLLVDRVLGGYGDPGLTQVPPFQVNWHKVPDTVRTFDIAEAERRLEAAGYATDDQGRRLDQEGNPIVLDLVFPDSEATYPQSAQFIAEWFGQLGIQVNAQQYDSDTLIDIMLPPEAGDYTADYDLFIWGWAGDVDPNSLLEIFTCDQIGNSSDSMYCNPRYDELFQQQNVAETPEERKALIDEMQEIFYNEAPYHVLFYDATLSAYRTDRFTGWVNQPDNGTPLFGYGPHGYTALQLASEGGESPSPGASPTTPADGASPAPGDGASPAPG
ncbi:MAG TPA: ABC transporter substrate-binding protein, partial [Vitreimonas sp.]|nr:ABC transporter substrate-binding protein [Vitreimonas sp.]